MRLWKANSSWINPRMVPGLCLWLDAQDPSANGTQPSNGTSMAYWTDKSGQANDAAQAVSLLQPVYTDSAFVNGTTRNGLLFTSASAQLMSISTFNGYPSGSQGRTIFIIASTADSTVSQNYYNYGNTVFNQCFGLFNGGTGTSHLAVDTFGGAFEGTPTTVTDNTTCIFEVNYPSGANVDAATMYVNTVLQTNSALARVPNTVNVINFVGAQVNGSSFMNGYIGEIIIYNNAISTENQTMVRQYLLNKYGL